MEEADFRSSRGRTSRELRCVDRLVLDLVTTLLRDSRPAPVIIIVPADHGSRFAGPRPSSHRPESVSTALIRERFGAFGAFHLPAGGETHSPER